jgi:hypothetical protein
MPTYVLPAYRNRRGVRTIDEGRERPDAAREAFETTGAARCSTSHEKRGAPLTRSSEAFPGDAYLRVVATFR